MIAEQIRPAVIEWRESGYPGTTETTKRLIEYWFEEDHELGDEEFEFWRCQREAIETLIYLREVEGYESIAEVRDDFSQQQRFGQTESSSLSWPKFCFKMATGSGKTFVMALALVWSYYNDLHDEGDIYSTNFAIISPNIIVLDRLREAFEGNQLFIEFPFFIPNEWEHKFDLQKIIRSEQEPTTGRAVLHITNRHQLESRDSDEPVNPIDAALQTDSPLDSDGNPDIDLHELLSSYDDLMVFNDEAHHVHPGTQWHDTMTEFAGDHSPLTQLDFSATPSDADGNLFPHIIYNYPLSAAIEDGITKRPKLAFLENVSADIDTGDNFVEENQVQLETGVRLHEERKKELDGTGEKPVLFIMCDTTDHADDVGNFLEQEMGYDDRVLVIHTYKRKTRKGDLQGDVRREELDEIREKAANIDNNQYEIIVSVLMLTEGWDVRNVTNIVPLRAYDSQILVEQTMGRGLRRMFPHQEDLTEELVIVEHPRFREVWNQEIEDRELDIEVTSAEDHQPEATTIRVDEDQLEYDLQIPILSGGLTKRQPDLSQLKTDSLPKNEFDLKKIEVPSPQLIKQDLLSGEVEESRDISFNLTTDYTHYLGEIAIAILEGRGSRTQLPGLLPKIKTYIEQEMFIQELDPSDEETMKILNHIPVRRHLVDSFRDALDQLSLVEQARMLTQVFELSQLQPYQTSRPVHQSSKCVLDNLPYDSDLEREFMAYLDRQSSVEAYTKIFSAMPFRIPYHDPNERRIRRYIPDFAIKLTSGSYLLVETKGEVYDGSDEVEQKAKAARRWCEAATQITRENDSLSDQTWSYHKISGSEFNKNKMQSIDTWLVP